MRKIVVGVDESDGAAEALRWAVQEGRAHDVPVVALLAWGFLDQHLTGSRFDPGYNEHTALAILDKLVDDAVGPEGVDVGRQAVCDLPERALVEAATNEDLLVVGARGLGGFGGLLLGSVSHRCLHHARGPLAVVRPLLPRNRLGRVLVAYDGSQPADAALAFGLAEGRARKAIVEVLYTWEPPYVTGFPVAGETIDTASIERAGCQLLEDALAQADVSGLVGPVLQTMRFGRAAETILREAAFADLVVVGSRGLGPLSSVLRGSVTVQVTQHAPCPVVVIPPTE